MDKGGRESDRLFFGQGWPYAAGARMRKSGVSQYLSPVIRVVNEQYLCREAKNMDVQIAVYLFF